jgi:hypothetical protein
MGKAEEIPLVVNTPKPSLQRTLVASNQLMLKNDSSLPPQKAIAFLDGGIALPTRVRSAQKLTVPLVLSEALVDLRDREVVPAGATIIAEVTSNGTVVEFTPKTLSFEREEQYYELNLAQGSVLVTGEQGPIIAKIETVGQEGEGLSLAQIAQLTTAAGGLAGIEGARDLSLIFNALGGGRRANYSSNRGIQLYTVAEGTEVVVRIVRNLPFNLPRQTSSQSPVTEFDFDQEDIDNYQQEKELDFENSNYYEDELDFEYYE